MVPPPASNRLIRLTDFMAKCRSGVDEGINRSPLTDRVGHTFLQPFATTARHLRGHTPFGLVSLFSLFRATSISNISSGFLPSHLRTLSTMSLPQALEEALFDSLSTGTFVDVKIYAFSQHTSSGRVRAPKPLYANGHVLQTVPYFHSRKDSFACSPWDYYRKLFGISHSAL